MDIWQFNLRHLRATIAIAEHGSVSAAARAIGITQPAITQGIARLEEVLGAELFERRPDGMQPTAAAAILVPRAVSALAHIRSNGVTMVQLHALVALARAGSYAGASQATGLSRPSLHRAVNDLSIVLRRALVERRGKGIVLTEQGRRTARAFRLAAGELRSALSELAGLGGHDTGRIVVGAMPLSRARLLPAAISRFLERNPDATAEVVEGAYAELAEPLRDGEMDFMIGALRPASPEDVVQRPLFEDRPVVMARRDHPLHGRKQVGIADLAGCRWIVPPRGTPLRDNLDRWFAQASLPPPQVPVDCGSVITIREMLVATDFITVLSPDQARVELEAGWLVQIGKVPPWFYRTIGITTRAGWRPTSLQQHFIDCLEAVAKDI
ncbi:MAG: LysR substrate-binding domain-containing protein [Sphingobium sp.]